MQKRNGYREGKKGVQVWMSLTLYGQMRGAAERSGVSLQEWLVGAVREKVMRDAAAGDGSRRGVSAAPVGGGSGHHPGVAGGLPAGVGPTGADIPVDPFAGLAMPPPVIVRDTVSQDPWEDIA